MKPYQVTVIMLVEAIDEDHAEVQTRDAIIDQGAAALASGILTITEVTEIEDES
jgi:hypothetical protein